MTALAMALIPLLQAVFAQGGISAALGSLTFAQWATIGIKAATAGPEALSFLKSLHPALATFAEFIEKNGGEMGAKLFHESLPQILADNGNAAAELPQLGAGAES